MRHSKPRQWLLGVALLAAALVTSASHRSSSESAVADAAMRGDTAMVRLLLKSGADVNAAQADGMTALHWAASHGEEAEARMLLAAGARVAALTRNGNYTALHFSAKSGSAAVVRVLLLAGADVMAATTTGGATALHFAAANGDALTVDALLDGGASVDERESAWAQTPLMWAASYNRVGAIEALLRRGARIEAVSRIEDVPARERADRALLTARARRVAAIKAAEQVPTPAVVPSAAGAKAAVDTSKRPAAPAVANATAAAGGRSGGRDGGAPVAADSARAAQGQQGLINRGPSYGELIGNKGGLTPLLFAVRDGNVEAVEALLNAGAKVNHVSEGDQTSPVLMATINGRFDMAKMLLARGANPKLASEAGATPLYATINVQWAAKSLYPQPTAQLQQTTHYLELMETLLKGGADPNVRLKKHLWYMSFNFDLLGVNTSGATPFWRAAYGTDVDAMKLLMRYGADPNMPTLKPVGRLPGDDSPPDDDRNGGKDPSGLLPIPAGGPGVFPLLAASGVGYGEGFAANSHRHAPDGWLPAVKYLIEELHADPNTRDHNGYNALHHAAARGDNELIEYLMTKGVDITALSRRGQTVADMANGPVQRIPPFVETVALLEKLGSKNSNKCRSC